jgi:hypothetical protein
MIIVVFMTARAAVTIRMVVMVVVVIINTGRRVGRSSRQDMVRSFSFGVSW